MTFFNVLKRNLLANLLILAWFTSVISSLVNRQSIMSPQQVAAARLSCSLKQIQRVRQSLPSVIEMVTPQRYHFAHHKRDCTQLFKHCTHTHNSVLPACGPLLCGEQVLHIEK